MQKFVVAVIVGLGLGASSLYLLVATPVAAAQAERPSVAFNADGTVQLPTGFRKWVFVRFWRTCHEPHYGAREVRGNSAAN